MTTDNIHTIWEHTFSEPCGISNITLYNRTHNKVKYWTYTCQLTNGFTINWSMTTAQQCCESYSTFVGTVSDRDSIQCTEYDINIQETRTNVLANVSRNYPNFNYLDLRFTHLRVVTETEPISETNNTYTSTCINRPTSKCTSRLQFGNARLDSIQLGMQCVGQYPHNTLLELINPCGQLVYEKTFILC
jgi:hypothetical protein